MPDLVVQTAIAKLACKNVVAVLAPDERHLETAALISEGLGLPHNSPAAVRTATHKHLSRANLKHSAEQLIPNFVLVDLEQSSSNKIAEVTFPCVVKPVTMSASRGVIRADNRTQLTQALHRVNQILFNEFGDLAPKEVLIEDYIDGTEHALEGYLSKSKLETICLFDKPAPLRGPYFEETYYVTPSRLQNHIQYRIQQVVQEGCQSLGLQMGPIHAEVRVEQGKVWILEIAPRTVGGDCGRIFELATKSSLEEFVLGRVAGIHNDSMRLSSALGVLMIPVVEDGILRRIEGVTEALSVANVLEVQLDVRAGQKMVRWPEGGKYPGFIYASAQTPQLVYNSLREAHSCLNFVCAPNLPVTVA